MLDAPDRDDDLPRRAGLATFAAAFKPKRNLLVVGDGIPLEEFLSASPERWVR